MKRLTIGVLLIFVGLSIPLLSGNLQAQRLTESGSASGNSIYPSFPGWNNWLINSVYWSTNQFNGPFHSLYLRDTFSDLPIRSPYWSAGQSMGPYDNSYQAPGPFMSLPVTGSLWNTEPSKVPVGDNTFMTNSMDWMALAISSRAGLWYWPYTAPEWINSLYNQILDLKPSDPDTTDEVIDFPGLWQQIAEAVANGLPRTAIELLEELIPLAVEHEKYGLAMKAICKQLVLEANIEGNKPEEKITRLTEEIENAPELLKPLLNLVLAQWYWHYYQNNRWRFSERDATAEIIDTDFTTWDLPRLLDKIDELYTAVLSREEELKSTPMDMFTDFFELGSVPLSYRPTLFDFSAFSAISFYRDGDQVRIKPEDTFELAADSDAFAPAEVFIQYSPKTTDTSSPLLKALKLYQKLLTFHRNDLSKEAFIDADINRLVFVKAYAFGEEKSIRYIARLSEIAETCSVASLSSLIYYHCAQELYNQNILQEYLLIEFQRNRLFASY